MKIETRRPLCFSEIGRKDNQEDYLWPDAQHVSAADRVFLMCDGIGGHECGEVASMTAGRALGTYIREHFDLDAPFTKDDFQKALDHAYDEMDKADTGGAVKMGTTMTCLVLHRGGALVAHIGDSRIYHVRPSLAAGQGRTGIIYQSTDHSLVNDLLRAGELTEEEAADYPHKNIITRAMQPHQERRSKADVYAIADLKAGDYFFLCCDGVLEQLTNDRLGEILADASLSDEGRIAAIKAVCDGRTRDNYTCWLIPIDQVVMEDTDVVETDDELISAEPAEDADTILDAEVTVEALQVEGQDAKAPADSTIRVPSEIVWGHNTTPMPAPRRKRSWANVKIVLVMLFAMTLTWLAGYYGRILYDSHNAGKTEQAQQPVPLVPQTGTEAPGSSPSVTDEGKEQVDAKESQSADSPEQTEETSQKPEKQVQPEKEQKPEIKTQPEIKPQPEAQQQTEAESR